jgi:hypothetical protein
MRGSPVKPFSLINSTAPEFCPSAAQNISPSRERRHRPRVLLELPVRIRWLGPFGLETEITQTRNAGRGGLLVSGGSPRQFGSLLWATFPYDPAVAFTESETPGRVVRCAADSRADIPRGNTIAIAFHQADLHPHGDAHSQNNSSDHAGRNDRRRNARISLAYLIHVERIGRNSRTSLRQELDQSTFPEEAMTVEVSPVGMLFCTLRIYEAGEQLAIASQVGRRLSGSEHRARVVRISPAQKDSPVSHVAVEFLS